MVNTKQQYSLSERFEVAFNQIHESLKKKVRSNSDRFSTLVRYGTSYKMIKTYQNELYQFAKLRNAFVHEKTELGFYIAEPHLEVVQRIEKIAEILSRPNYALSIANKEIISYEYEDSIEEIVQGLKMHPYSQFPIYKNSECTGLLTTRSIVNWMAEYVVNSIVDLSDVKVRDILQFEPNHYTEFVPKTIDIFEVEDIFEEHHKSKQQLELVIITENGLKHEKPLGIITAWDLIEIDYTAD